MMTRLFTSFVALACFLCPPAAGPARAQHHTAYCDKTESTADFLSCVGRHHKAAQKRLKSNYEKYVAESEADNGDDIKDNIETMRGLQTDWLAYRDRQCAFEATLADSESLKRLYELSCLARMTDDRADMLAVSLLDAENEPGQGREFGPYPRWMNVLAHDYPDIFWQYGKRLRADLNCDSEEEYIMLGTSLSSFPDSQKAGQHEAQNREGAGADSSDTGGFTPVAYQAEIVVAIAENAQQGRPRADIFHLPVGTATQPEADGKMEAHVHLCRQQTYLSVVPAPLSAGPGPVPQAKPAPASFADKPEKTDAAAAAAGQSQDQEQGQGKNGHGDPPYSAENCSVALQISDKKCRPVTIYWTGTGYEIVPPPQPSGQALNQSKG